MKKVLLLSASFGDGHRQVANALIQELAENSIEAVTVDSFRSTSKQVARLNEQLYEQLTRYVPGVYGFSYHATASLPVNHWLWQALAALSRKAAWVAVRENEPDVVLQLFPDHALRTLPRNIKKRPRVGVVLTDYAIHSRWFHSGVNFYCFPHPVVAKNAEQWILQNQSVQVTGIPLRKQFASAMHHRTKPSSYIVIATGGRGVFPDLNPVISVIRAAFPNLKVVVLCGRNRQILNRVGQIQNGDSFVDAVPFTEDMATLYREAAFAVVKAGGLTVAECHACHCPMVFYKPMSGQERVNAKVCETLGTGLIVRNLEEFQKVLIKLSNPNLEIMRKACSDAARPFAAKEVVSEIIRQL
jgi:processive 1,2-diacylglycerol beta-glucosyltransferase